MAPSALIALLVAVSLLQPSAAIRIPPILPCMAGLPKIPFLPCYALRPASPLPGPPPECWTPLEKLAPCASFFTGDSASAPGACCDGYHYVVDHAGICFCHYANGDIGKIIPGTLNSTRLFGLSEACGSNIRLEAFKDCSMFKYVPPMTPPPSPSPSLPPAA